MGIPRVLVLFLGALVGGNCVTYFECSKAAFECVLVFNYILHIWRCQVQPLFLGMYSVLILGCTTNKILKTRFLSLWRNCVQRLLACFRTQNPVILRLPLIVIVDSVPLSFLSLKYCSNYLPPLDFLNVRRSYDVIYWKFLSLRGGPIS